MIGSPEVSKGENLTQALAVGRPERNKGPKVTKGETWNQALAVGMAKRKYEQRPQSN